MRAFSKALMVVSVVSVLGLSGCAGTAPTEFTIPTGALESKEIPLDGFKRTTLASRVFDVVNQDVNSENNTGIAGKVDPNAVDILSSYASKKFRAGGGENTARFVIQKAEFTVNPVESKETGWLWDNTVYKAELSTNLSVMLVASRPDGLTAHINATTSQSQQTSLDTTPENRREVYMQLMARAVDALDGEFNKQLPQWFGDVVVK
ncbi:MAG: hypothetical protein K2Q32_00815 [Alphaproteobacteria bacterium]|nr:hypothetical protein [Alphaproteobacteria bacterium]